MDLTPFGFTPTETAAYRTLTALGPLSGYALAKALSIARANAYQALHGLVAKGAAARLGGRPERFRPIQPAALFTAIVQRSARRLDVLEAELSQGPPGTAATIPLTGRRALVDTALRTAARAAGEVTCIAPRGELVALAPAWHRRAAAGWTAALWSLEEPSAAVDLPFPVRHVSSATAVGYFGGPILALRAPEAAVLARLDADGASGFWTSDDVLIGVVHAAIDRVTIASVDTRSDGSIS